MSLSSGSLHFLNFASSSCAGNQRHCISLLFFNVLFCNHELGGQGVIIWRSSWCCAWWLPVLKRFWPVMCEHTSELPNIASRTGQ
jgi:hypothetical protein